MKKSVILAAPLLIGVALSGCPVYDGDAGCYDDYDCEYGYQCDARSGVCYIADDEDDEVTCRKPSDCGPNETCSRFGTCSSGDCHYSTIGCVKGYVCTLEETRYACVEGAASGGAGGADAGAGGQGDAGGQAGASAGSGG